VDAIRIGVPVPCAPVVVVVVVVVADTERELNELMEPNVDDMLPFRLRPAAAGSESGRGNGAALSGITPDTGIVELSMLGQLLFWCCR